MAVDQITRLQWGAELAAGIEATVGDDGAAIARDVQTGAAAGWRINDGAAYLVTRMECIADRVEFVVVAAQGRGLLEIAPILYDAARQAGCARVRWHTQRPALARLIGRAFDVREVERVFSVEVE